MTDPQHNRETIEQIATLFGVLERRGVTRKEVVERLADNDIRERMKPEKTPCTPDDLLAIKALDGITFVPGIPTKRFARQIQGAKELTDKQRDYVWGTIWRFRRQVPDKRLVRIAEERQVKP